jgi:hypothetical protein
MYLLNDLNDSHFVSAQPQGADMLDRKALGDYGNWIGQTPLDVYDSVIAVGGWQNVFPGALPIWASRIRQYFNINPMSLKLLDNDKGSVYRARAQKAIPAAFAKAYRSLSNWDPRVGDEIGTLKALSGEVYEDPRGRSIWFQMSPGAAIYHFPKLPSSPTREAIEANELGQARIPVFKLVSPDGTGGSRECVITNNGRAIVGAVNEEVNLAGRFIKDSVRQGSYNYAETVEKGLAAHQRLDVNTDPMRPGYFVEPPDLFLFSELYMRLFPEKDGVGPVGKPLAAQTRNAP